MNQLFLLVSLGFFTAGFSFGDRSRPLGDDSLKNGCTECHTGIVGQDIMHPVVEDACDNCHLATDESHPAEGVPGFTLVENVPDLCFICHEEVPPSVHGHSPVQGGDCLSCHDAHGSSEPGIIKQPEQELCMSCHKDIRTLVRGKGMAHSAIEGGGCIQCHLAHGSELPALLVDRYPVEEYVPATIENFGLCFLCHDPDLIEAEETEWGTGFRNGTLNLHRLHINGDKGRNCKLCHNLHGSTGKFLISDEVVFGKWVMKMNFIPVENGGTCSPGCHGSKTYDR